MRQNKNLSIVHSVFVLAICYPSSGKVVEIRQKMEYNIFYVWKESHLTPALYAEYHTFYSYMCDIYTAECTLAYFLNIRWSY